MFHFVTDPFWAERGHPCRAFGEQVPGAQLTWRVTGAKSMRQELHGLYQQHQKPNEQLCRYIVH